MEPDPYEALGLQPDATHDEVKRAYRALARQWHPDRNKDPSAPEQFKRVARAYERLGDPAQRRTWDLREGRVARGELPEEFVDAVASAVERAQTWIEEHVLPHTLGRWRGVGAEVAARLVIDAERYTKPTMLPSGWWGRRRAGAVIDRVHVALDASPTAALSYLHFGRGRARIVVTPWPLWSAGFRDSGEIDDAILRVLLVRYAQVVSPGPWIAVDDPETSLRWARAADDAVVAQFRRRASLWGALALVTAILWVSAFNRW